MQGDILTPAHTLNP